MDEYKLNQPVKVKTCDGAVREGIIKGLSLDKKDELNITIEYSTPVQNIFKADSLVTE